MIYVLFIMIIGKRKTQICRIDCSNMQSDINVIKLRIINGKIKMKETNVHTYTCINTNTYIQTCTYIHTYIHTHTHTHIHTQRISLLTFALIEQMLAQRSLEHRDVLRQRKIE